MSKLQTIVVTGANGQVGQQLLKALQGQYSEVIALVRQPADLPATEVVTNWVNSLQAQHVIARADAIVHLAGTLNPENGDYNSANLHSTEVLLSALTPKTQRVIFLSYVGASRDSGNAYLATKAIAERRLKASGVPLTIFRCAHIIGSPEQPGATAKNLLSRNGKSISVLGSGQQVVTPIYLGDVVTAIVLALEHPHDGTFDLVGPGRFSMDGLVSLLNRNGGAFPRNHSLKVKHLPDRLARLLPWVVRGLPAALVDVMLRDSAGEPKRAVETFGLELTPLQQVWATA